MISELGHDLELNAVEIKGSLTRNPVTSDRNLPQLT